MKKTKQDRAGYMRDYRKTKKENTTEASALVTEIKRSYAAQRRLIQDAMNSVNVGTKIYLDHIALLSKLDQAERAELVQRGLVTKDLGVAASPGWIFTCVTNGRGMTTCVEIKPGQTPPKSAPLPERTEKERRGIAELESEFPSDAPISRREKE